MPANTCSFQRGSCKRHTSKKIYLNSKATHCFQVMLSQLCTMVVFLTHLRLWSVEKPQKYFWTQVPEFRGCWAWETGKWDEKRSGKFSLLIWQVISIALWQCCRNEEPGVPSETCLWGGHQVPVACEARAYPELQGASLYMPLSPKAQCYSPDCLGTRH